MKLSEDGVDKLIVREGKRNKSYRDTKGIWTVGVGDIDLDNDGTRDVTKDTVETDEQIFTNLQLDVKWAEDCVNAVDCPLSQSQFDALVSFVFNIGATAFNKSTMKRLLNAGEYDEAAEQFDAWNKPASIIGRRNGEKEQFLS